MKVKSVITPMQWIQRKRKRLREKKDQDQHVTLESLNKVDLAELEARHIVTLEELKTESTGSHASGELSKPWSETSKYANVERTSTRSFQLDGEEIVSNLGLSERCLDGMSSCDTDSEDLDDETVDVIIGTGGMMQKGQAGMASLFEESFHLDPMNDDSRNSLRNHKNKRASLKMTQEDLKAVPELLAVLRAERVKEWARRFRRSDPRHQIMTYFDEVSILGVDAIAKQGRVEAEKISPLLKMFCKSAIFTVWRPTSMESIREMMKGQGVGKGLDIKGKSAKTGKLSGFVPFLQLYEESHKRQIRTLPKKSSMRIFFQREELRNVVAEELTAVGEEMLDGFYEAQEILANEEASDMEQERAMEKFMWEMDDPEIVIIDDYANADKPVWGIEMPERLFWEAFVMRQDISREPGSEDDIGRPSQPVFQDMNFAALRQPPLKDKNGEKTLDRPRPVVYQNSLKNPMNAKDLLVAYEESGRVLPVVSDFDCFLVGTKGVSFEAPIPKDQIDLANWCVSKIENIFDAGPKPSSWTERWFEVLKEDPIHPRIPPYGFGDPKSYSLMEIAVDRLKTDGCVRHGAECFNYYFPQELDDHFLVIGEGMNDKGPPWIYVDVAGLQEILMEKIQCGYTFPLNPKWILCDPGWRKIYEAMLQSENPNVQNSMNCWYPPQSGLRENIARISEKYPKGFVKGSMDNKVKQGLKSRLSMLSCDEYDGTAAMDLAELELKSYETLKRAKRKMKSLLIWMSFVMQYQRESKARKQHLSLDDEEDNQTSGESLRRRIQPVLRDNLRQGFKPQQLKIRASVELNNDEATKLLDRLKVHSSFVGASTRQITSSLLHKRSLPVPTVAASIPRPYAGLALRNTMPAIQDSSSTLLDEESLGSWDSDHDLYKSSLVIGLDSENDRNRSSSQKLQSSSPDLCAMTKEPSHSEIPKRRLRAPDPCTDDLTSPFSSKRRPPEYEERSASRSASLENSFDEEMNRLSLRWKEPKMGDCQSPRDDASTEVDHRRNSRKILDGSLTHVPLRNSILSLPSKGTRGQLRPPSSVVTLADLHRAVNEKDSDNDLLTHDIEKDSDSD